MEILRADQRERWDAVLRECGTHDFHHTAAYHLIAEQRGEGTAHLLVHREEGFTIALPVLLRSIESVPGLATAGAGLMDATSVYGYAGPIRSHAEIPATVQEHFRQSLRAALLSLRVVTVFARLHPLLDQESLLSGLGDVTPLGKTIAIDLTIPLEDQRKRYRRNHRRDLKSLTAAGVTCIRDERREYIREFVAIYHEAMRRLDASEGYFFDEDYFTRLLTGLGDSIQLFICMLGGKPIAGCVFSATGKIGQAHLAGCLDAFVSMAPLKLLYDAATIWARERGCRTMHIGGGVGSREDSLYAFKFGFSEITHQFCTWRWIVDPAVNDHLSAEASRWHQSQGLGVADPQFFPLYRATPKPPQPGVAESEKPTGVVVFGGGGHAKVVIATLLASGMAVLGIEDDDRKKWGSRCAGLSIAKPGTLGGTRGVIAIGDNAQRKNVATSSAMDWHTAVHPAAFVDPTALLGPGTVVFAGAVVQASAAVGHHAIVNTGATVDHDCVIGSFAHIAPGVHLAGNVVIGEGAFVGIGAVVLPGVKVGAWSTVGAGSMVNHDLPDGVTAYGSPAKIHHS